MGGGSSTVATAVSGAGVLAVKFTTGDTNVAEFAGEFRGCTEFCWETGGRYRSWMRYTGIQIFIVYWKFQSLQGE